MPGVKVRARAVDDLDRMFDYLEWNGGLAVAIRFEESAKATFLQLAQYPEMGAPLPVSHLRFADLRQWRVNDFEQYLIFYRPRRDGVAIVRLMHSSQNWWKKLTLNLN
jgi:toxin ParE1/3/4